MCIRIPSKNRRQQQAEKSSPAAGSDLGCVQNRAALKHEDLINDVRFRI